MSAMRPGESRLDYMLRIMRDPKLERSVRIAMAKAALPLPAVRIPWGEI